MNVISILIESFRIAIHSLFNNKMRSFLSLLGISIGIFSIIFVKSAVDSFHDTIQNGFAEFGSDVVYVDKQPWMINSRKDWKKYQKRPDIEIRHYEHLLENLQLAEEVSFSAFSGGEVIKYESNSVSNAFIVGGTYNYKEINALNLQDGRYFNQLEVENGLNSIILGNTIANSLFEGINPIGKKVKLFGQKFIVIGVLEKEGENMFSFMNFDEVLWISLNCFKKYIPIDNNKNIFKSLAIKAKPDVELDDLKDEIIGYMRGKRYLRPRDENNFSINEISMLNEMLDQLFGIINIAGMFIGGFALIIGMFSVANIMFVSVKERTNIIGIKKALGAKRSVILSEFLIEAILLCIIGGILGLLFVYGILLIVSQISPIEMYISPINVAIGLFASIVVGLVSGIIPALNASKLDPVDAIRK